MKMKKIVLALVLALVLATVAIVCVSCTKKEAALEKGTVSYTVINNTGKNVIKMSLSDMRSENKMEAEPKDGGLPDGQSVGIELSAMLEKNAPDVMFSYTVEGGNSVSAHVYQKNGTITMMNGTDGLTFEVSALTK